jgi:hypothetical protein
MIESKVITYGDEFMKNFNENHAFDLTKVDARRSRIRRCRSFTAR